MINKQLTKEFLLTHGVIQDGSDLVIKGTDIKLIPTDKSNYFMIDIPGLPVEVQQPKPISTYSELIQLMLNALSVHINSVKHELSNEEFADRLKSLSNYFDFDEDILMYFGIYQGVIQVLPKNAYTLTLLHNVENEFIVYYTLAGNPLPKELKFSINPQCVCTSYLKSIISAYCNCYKSHVNIQRVDIVTEKGLDPFFGCGVNGLLD